jgi:hypothetical protein
MYYFPIQRLILQPITAKDPGVVASSLAFGSVHPGQVPWINGWVQRRFFFHPLPVRHIPIEEIIHSELVVNERDA